MTDPNTRRLPDRLFTIDRTRPPYVGPTHPLYGGAGPVPDRFIPAPRQPEDELTAWHGFLVHLAQQEAVRTAGAAHRARHARRRGLWSMLTRRPA